MENTYIKRDIEERLFKHLKQFPVTALCGPRQCGKTTLLKHYLGKSHEFISLDDMDKRQEAEKDPKMFMSRIDGPCVIDEIQYAPNLLSYIKMAVDEDRKPGKFVLTGSQQFLLMKGLSESLAGRVGILNLYPFHALEVDAAGEMTSKAKFEAAVLRGFYPEVFLKKGIDTRLWHENYMKTYLERDIRNIYNISSLGDFRDFMKITAARAAQLYNITAVSSAARTPATTVKRWLSILNATGIIFMIRPFHTNFGKRFTKMPKIYFYDTGLLCNLLGIRNTEQLAESVFYGNIFENYCMSEVFKILGCRGRENDAYFLRTKKGLEADFVFEDSGRYLFAEFKTGKSMDTGVLNSLRHVQEEIKPLKAYKSLLVNMTDDVVPRETGAGTAGANEFFRMIGEIK
jgi:uncharacterized protein